MKKLKVKSQKFKVECLFLFFVFNFGLLTLDFGLSIAGEKQWSAAGDAVSWEDASNWYPAVLPTGSDDASIDAENASALASKTFVAKTVTVGGRKESIFTTNDFIYGTITPDKNTDNALYIRKDGSVTLKGAGDITLKGAFKNSEESLSSEPSFMFGAE